MADEWPRVRDVANGLLRYAADQVRQGVESWAGSRSEAIWQSAEHDLLEHFGRIGSSVQAAFSAAGYGMGTGGRGAPGHPLHCYVSFHPPGPRDGAAMAGGEHAWSVEDVVENAWSDELSLSADFREGAGTLRYSCEISQFSGDRWTVLKEGPAGVIGVPYGVIGSYGAIRAALGEIKDFASRSQPFLRERLSRWP